MAEQEGEGLFATVREGIASRFNEASSDFALKTKGWTLTKIAKKIAFYFTLIVLTTAASVLLGILSWAGMWAILPVLAVAAMAGFLSVIFEGEIYLQNIKGALIKLFKNEYLKKYLGRKYFEEALKNHKETGKVFEAALNNHADETKPFNTPFLQNYKGCLERLKQIQEDIKTAEQMGNHREEEKLVMLKREQDCLGKKRKSFYKLFTKIMFTQEWHLTTHEREIQTDFYNSQAGEGEEHVAALKAERNIFKSKFLQDYVVCLKQLKQVNMNIKEAKKIEDRKEREKTLLDLKQQRADIEKNRTPFSKIFTKIIFTKKEQLTPYEKQLHDDFYDSLQEKSLEVNKSQEDFETLVKKRQKYYHFAKIWAFLSFAAVSFGTIYLLGGVIELLPAAILLASPLLASPFVLIPISLVVGLAYGLMIYNSITDMINNETVQKWRKIFFGNELSNEKKWKRRVMFLAGATLFTLAIALSVCTGGTWWTITQDVPIFLNWMNTIAPGVLIFIRTVVAFVTTIATGIFDVENTSTTLDMGEDLLKGKKSDLYEKWRIKKESMKKQWADETFAENCNPFRIILMIVFVPLQALFFLGHLVSIGVDVDRVFGIPAILSAVLGTISEFFQDLHYFLKFMGDDCHEEHHGHNHSLDLPTRFLLLILSPLCIASMLWAHLARKKPVKTEPNIKKAVAISIETQAELALFQRNRYDQKHHIKPDIREEKEIKDDLVPDRAFIEAKEEQKVSAFQALDAQLSLLSTPPPKDEQKMEAVIDLEMLRLERMPNPWAAYKESNTAEQKGEGGQVALAFATLREQDSELNREPVNAEKPSISKLISNACDIATREQSMAREQKPVKCTDMGMGFFCTSKASANLAYKEGRRIDYGREMVHQISASA